MTDLYPDDELGPPPDSPDKSMYDRLGPTTVRVVVEDLYRRVFADPVLSPYFADLTPSGAATLRRHFGLYLRQILGASTHYTLDELGKRHHDLDPPVTERTFARFGAHLLAALREFGVDADAVLAVADALAAIRPAFVATPGADPAHRPRGPDRVDEGR